MDDVLSFLMEKTAIFTRFIVIGDAWLMKER
jgi:hypothetical protein